MKVDTAGPQILNVSVRLNRDGWFVASCESLPGLFVAHPDMDTVLQEIPEIIEKLYLVEYGLDVARAGGNVLSDAI